MALSTSDSMQVASIVTSNRKLAMKSSIVLTFLSLAWLQVVTGIKCYQCSSLTNSKCGENFHESPTMIVDCDEDIYPIAPPVKASFCRKIHQTIYGEVRITRSCGYLESKRTRKNKCEQVSFVEASESKYCECSKDLCNGGGKLISKINLVAMTSVLLVIRMYF